MKEFDEIYGFKFVKEPQDFNEDYLISFMEYIYNFIVSLDNRFLFLDRGKDFYVQQIVRVLDRIGYI